MVVEVHMNEIKAILVVTSCRCENGKQGEEKCLKAFCSARSGAIDVGHKLNPLE